MSRLTTIAAAEEAVEISRNDFSISNPYTLSTANNSGIVDNKTDNTERSTELARNDYSANNPYNFSSLGNSNS